jgi:hypothetical protein
LGEGGAAEAGGPLAAAALAGGGFGVVGAIGVAGAAAVLAVGVRGAERADAVAPGDGRVAGERGCRLLLTWLLPPPPLLLLLADADRVAAVAGAPDGVRPLCAALPGPAAQRVAAVLGGRRCAAGKRCAWGGADAAACAERA